MQDYKITASLAITLQAYVLMMSSKEQQGHALLMLLTSILLLYLRLGVCSNQINLCCPETVRLCIVKKKKKSLKSGSGSLVCPASV